MLSHLLASTVGNQVGTMEHRRNIELDCAAIAGRDASRNTVGVE